MVMQRGRQPASAPLVESALPRSEGILRPPPNPIIALEKCIETAQASLQDVKERLAALQEGEAALARGWQQLEEEEERRRSSDVALREVEAALQRKQLQLQEEALEVEQARQRLDEERGIRRDDDVVALNFGGEKVVQVKRSLLLQYEDSKMAQMFGAGDAHLDRDGNGHYFLDYPPDVMCPLIKILRLKRDGAKALPAPDLDSEDMIAWELMLKSMGLPPRFDDFSFFRGIQHDVSLSSFNAWTTVLVKPYSHVTSDADFRLSSDLRCGALLLGAKRKGSSELSLAAMGDYEVVTGRTAGDATVEHNGLYWYCNSEKAIGFAPSSKVVLSNADLHEKDCPQRLSWYFFWGGGRAGAASYLNNDDWEKVILACPLKIAQLLQN